MFSLIDNILDQNQVQVGDILVFDGPARQSSLRSFKSGPITFGQRLFFTSLFRPTYMHTAICTKADETQNGKEITIGHLSDTGPCSGEAKLDVHNINTKPFTRPFIIVRPPAPDVQKKLAETAAKGPMHKINPAKTCYLRTLFGTSKRTVSAKPITSFASENTCIGFVINSLHMAHNEINVAPYELSMNTSSTEFLSHHASTRDKNGWQVLLVPGYKPCKNNDKISYEPIELETTIKTMAESYCRELEGKSWFKISAKEKAATIRTACQNFEHNESKSVLENARNLLTGLKPLMEQGRILGRSNSFEHLLEKLAKHGIYQEYLETADLMSLS